MRAWRARRVRVVHQIPHRVRVRPWTGRWDGAQRASLARALAGHPGVYGFRLAAGGQSLTVHHTAQLQAVIDTVHAAVQEHAPAAGTHPQPPAPAAGKRWARRRLLACAVVTLAIALLPEPIVPAMIVLRLLAAAIAAVVRYQAEAHADPCRLTRLLDGIACAIGIARAENVLRALVKHAIQQWATRWAEARLRQAFGQAA